MVEMHKFSELRNEGWVADWKDKNALKWGIRADDYYCVAKSPVSSIRFECNDFTFGIAVKSQTIAEEMLEIFGDRIKEIYNTQL